MILAAEVAILRTSLLGVLTLTGWIFVWLETSNEVAAAPTKTRRSKGRSIDKVAARRENFLTPEGLSYRW